MTRTALLASILILVAACDKAKQGLGRGLGAGDDADVVTDPLPLSPKPDILFQVFGERDDPRMIPIAAIVSGSLKAINLTAADWKRFDSLYTRSETRYTAYQGGVAAGHAVVRQGMWEKQSPIYSLPSCRNLTPLAAVKLEGPIKSGFTVELFASTSPLATAPKGQAMADELASKEGRIIGHAVGEKAGLEGSALDSLDFNVRAINTGATAEPTLVVSFVDPGADDGQQGARTAHVFAIADRKGGEYAPSFEHSVSGSAAGAEYYRFLDHLDVTGDGVDEIFLERWQNDGDTYLVVMGFTGGRWQEIFRGRPSWCLDVRK